MNDEKKLQQMGETDLLNLLNSHDGLDVANLRLAKENARLTAELAEARLYLEMALIYDSDEKEKRFNELLNQTFNCAEHPRNWELPCKCHLCRSYG